MGDLFKQYRESINTVYGRLGDGKICFIRDGAYRGM